MQNICFIYVHLFIHPSRVYYELNMTSSQVGVIAQFVEHCTGIAEVMSSNPVQARIFFRLSFRNCLSCVVTAMILLLFDLSSAVQNICFIYLHLFCKTVVGNYANSNCCCQRCLYQTQWNVSLWFSNELIVFSNPEHRKEEF